MTQPALEKRDLVPYGDRGVILRDLGECFRFAQAVVQSGLAPKALDTAQKVMIAIQSGAELGMPPMQSVSSYAVIGGRAALMVEPALALVMASGQLDQRAVVFSDAGQFRRCTVQLVRRGGLGVEWSYSMEDAKRAGLLSNPNWQKHPDRMLYNRAMGFCLHDLFPDVLRGHAIVGADDDYDGVREVNVTPPARAIETGPDPLLAQLEAGATSIALELEVEPPEAIPTEESDHARSAE